MSRICEWIRSLAARTPGRAPYPVRLTPGQYAEFRQEIGADGAGFEQLSIKTCLGVHPVERIECHTRATGDNVILCAREDLFSEVDRGTGIELVSNANSVTSVPENVGCCEVVSVGELVHNVKPGDIAFIDFFDVRQGYIISHEELYVAGAHAFKARFDVEKQIVLPLDNYVVVKQANDRFKVALNGTDRIHVLDYLLTEGIISARASDGTPATHTLYAEVAHVAKLTERVREGVMTRADRRMLDTLCAPTEGGYEWSEYDGVTSEEAEAVNAVIRERTVGRDPDIKVGELVAFCRELATKVRVRGETQYLMRYSNVLAVIDDKAILEQAIREGRAGTLVRVA